MGRVGRSSITADAARGELSARLAASASLRARGAEAAGQARRGSMAKEHRP